MSFLPIAEGIWFGAYPVFIVTSVLAAGCDMLFVMMQQYNRHRVMKLLKRRSTLNEHSAPKIIRREYHE